MKLDHSIEKPTKHRWHQYGGHQSAISQQCNILSISIVYLDNGAQQQSFVRLSKDILSDRENAKYSILRHDENNENASGCPVMLW